MILARLIVTASFFAGLVFSQLPKPNQGGYELPNGWRITPLGMAKRS
jgi:hypothetical protein